jgi:L-threonylcarbamoyladenylate synthase
VTVSEGQVAAFASCIDNEGVALFGADTVYGLAVDPGSERAVARLYELKGRPATVPAAVMFFGLGAALGVLDATGPRTREAAAALLPGAVTLLVANPAGLWPLACGPDPATLGVRVPALPKRLAALRELGRPVLQSSANLHGAPDARRLEEVDRSIRTGADFELDAGELPGTASTVVDLRRIDVDGTHTIVREGPVPAGRVSELLA